MTDPTSSGDLLRFWRRCQCFPGGKRLFSRLLGRRVPYSGTIGARVEELTPGHARVRMADRRALRNHLRSIHAIALANLGELTTGLAMTAALPPQARGIPIQLSVEFLKKARGEIVAEADCEIPNGSQNREHQVRAVLSDDSGDTVARFAARWSIGPRS